MHEVTYQTVRLDKGRHSSPRQGACVMELASMLAGEAFTDHPQSVSQPIACFLRAYNDMLDDERRQDLYKYAAKTVGTAATDDVEQRRCQLMVAWADEIWRRRPTRIIHYFRRRTAQSRYADNPQAAARYAIRAIGKLSDGKHNSALSLVDELVRAESAAVPALSPLVAHRPVRDLELGGVS